MPKGVVIEPLRAWRVGRGFTHEQAGALVVVGGRPTNRGTYHAWESGKKLPSEPAMFELERVAGVEPNDFYKRPDAGARNKEPARQPSLV